ncbi:hypothetical protein CLG96_05520 [Sphingomonas oleivorans]|uniref:Uncharacterized protein n=1 Tax=Sphingomonas oleivorans TaxID=1735121 RepID=A0A2T5FZF1_9SPHN|nr:hypothetical protein [Sphingomonas oleivorans]PTQ12037.1 hypothetical protein CLG96_05520 [Sphingomonas oleivorans]
MSPAEAISILTVAVDRAGAETVQTPDLRAALTMLVTRCEDRSPLDRFWSGAGSPVAEDRRRILAASLREIRLQCP